MRHSAKNCRDKLDALGQSHLLKGCGSEPFLLQIEKLDERLFQEQQRLIRQPLPPLPPLSPPDPFTPVEGISNSYTQLSQGKVGCLIVAGGQGTRLGFKGPKGLFPIGSTTLYKILAERTLQASRKAHQFLPIAIMTSPDNHEETTAYFHKNDYFGLIPEQVDFLLQTELPLLDDAGNLFLGPAREIAQGPDGNGWALKNFHRSGLFEKWFQKGIRTLNFTLIDNVLADPFDPQLVNFHVEQNLDITVKGILRENPTEKVGIFAKQKGSLSVVEYSEFPAQECNALRDGKLEYPYANISLFSFKMEAIPTWDFDQMPWHLAHKPAIRHDQSRPLAWKFEKFIFDILPLAENVKGLLYPRKQCFAPLKSVEDLPRIQAALQSLSAAGNINL